LLDGLLKVRLQGWQEIPFFGTTRLHIVRTEIPQPRQFRTNVINVTSSGEKIHIRMSSVQLGQHNVDQIGQTGLMTEDLLSDDGFVLLDRLAELIPKASLHATRSSGSR